MHIAQVNIAPIEGLIAELWDRGGTDIHIAAGAPPMMRIDGDLYPVAGHDPLSPEDIEQLTDVMLAIGEAREGTTIVIDWLPDSGTRLTVNGQVKGKDIAGEDFYRALLKIWLGSKPAQDDLKQALLGKAA